jgi:hypothetical protein
MLNISSKQRFWKLGTLLICALLILSSTAPGYASNPASTTAFAEGKWAGVFSVHGNLTFEGGVTWAGFYNGKLDFISTGGELEGNFTYIGKGHLEMDSGSANAEYEILGDVLGISDAPMLQGTSMKIDIDGMIAGTVVITTLTFTENMGALPIYLISATCNQVVGDIETPVQQNFDDLGIQNSITGTFSAVRIGDVPEEFATNYQLEAGDLIDEAEAFKKAVTDTNKIDFAQLNDLITQAEKLGIGLKKNSDCGFGKSSDYLTIISDIIADISNFALKNAHLFSADDLGRLINAAIRVGVMGSGAPNQTQASDLANKFKFALENKLADAKQNNDCKQAISVQIAAGLLGDVNLKQSAAQEVSNLCGGN